MIKFFMEMEQSMSVNYLYYQKHQLCLKKYTHTHTSYNSLSGLLES